MPMVAELLYQNTACRKPNSTEFLVRKKDRDAESARPVQKGGTFIHPDFNRKCILKMNRVRAFEFNCGVSLLSEKRSHGAFFVTFPSKNIPLRISLDA